MISSWSNPSATRNTHEFTPLAAYRAWPAGAAAPHWCLSAPVVGRIIGAMLARTASAPSFSPVPVLT